MAVREILTLENPILRKKSVKVTEFDESLASLFDDMRDTLASTEHGCGLSAVQIGVLKRALIFTEQADNKVVEIANPRIIVRLNKQNVSEGCLSVPGKEGITKRPYGVIVTGKDRNGNSITINETGIDAAKICHEIDHLNGVLYFDRLAKGEALRDSQKADIPEKDG